MPHILGKRPSAFPGIHSILVQYTLDVNWCARSAELLWLRVSQHINLTQWHGSQRFVFHSLPCARGNRLGTKGLHLRL